VKPYYHPLIYVAGVIHYAMFAVLIATGNAVTNSGPTWQFGALFGSVLLSVACDRYWGRR
jgi:hypothetical protein